MKEDDSAALRGHTKKVAEFHLKRALLTASEESPRGHLEQVTLVRWHPVASNLLLSVAFDNTARVWDVNKVRRSVQQRRGTEEGAWERRRVARRARGWGAWRREGEPRSA